MPDVLELFNQSELLTYTSQRQYPALLGETLFPENKRQSLKFDMIKGAGSLPVAANVHDFNTEAEIGSREASAMALELALIKRKMQMKEEDIIALNAPRSAAEQEYLMKNVFNDVDTLVNGVRARVEAMRMEALASGVVTLQRNGLNMEIDYQVPDEHKEALAGTAAWTDASSDPIGDLERWADTLPTRPTRGLTSNAVMQALMRHPKIVGALFGTGSQRVPTRQDLNAFLEQHGLPVLAAYDNKYRVQNANGTYTQKRYFAQNALVLFSEGTLGETIYGPTPEEIRLMRDPAIDITKVGNILAMVYEETVDPVGTWTKAVATALPSFAAADEVFQAKPIA
ncbi:major capsid protein [Mesobacillus stamsii]|uniref:Major capsid protein n=1 Tax=Mesobacillus stamsii TaxID=225347 RepID=A0ABU0FTN0_9BACI|nr:major capsid protein [Mesobacillus stamsii]MDQ0412718.1 hypothetical protein [Mesobacillus stamsii]